MLVLTRRPDAGDRSDIQIGPDITITVVSLRGGEVRIGVTAPPDVPVHRREIYDEKQEHEKQEHEKQEHEKQEHEERGEAQAGDA